MLRKTLPVAEAGHAVRRPAIFAQRRRGVRHPWHRSLIRRGSSPNLDSKMVAEAVEVEWGFLPAKWPILSGEGSGS